MRWPRLEPVRALSRASEPFFRSPPQGFAEVPLLTPRGLLTVAGPDEMHHLEEAWATLQQTSPRGRRLTAAEALGHREFVLTRLYESA